MVLAMRLRNEIELRPMIVIAEDDDAIAYVIKTALTSAGFRTRRVYDGIEAINVILDTRPDAVVLDLDLPRLQGAEICSMVRKSRAVRHTPIVVISGHDEMGERLEIFELGADDFVTKPFSVAEMVARVKAVMHRAQLSSYATPFQT